MTRREFDAFAAGATTRLYRTAYLMVGDHYLAEDLVQDVLARVYVAWPRIRGEPHAYAYRAIAYAVANQRRWMRRHPEAHLPDNDPGVVVGNDADSIVVRNDVLGALRQLPPGQRVIIVLRYYVDLTEADTAQALMISVGTVKSQHARALTRLRALLGEDLAAAPDADPTTAASHRSAQSLPSQTGARHDPGPA